MRLAARLCLLLLLVMASPAAVAATHDLPELNVAALVTTPERLYVGSFDEGLFVVERDGRARPFRDPALHPHINALAWSEHARTLWVGTARGLVRCVMAGRASCRQLGAASAVHALGMLQDGTLVAGGDAGLTFVSGGETRAFGKKQKAPFRSVWSLAELDGKLFVGTTNGLFWGAPSTFAAGGSKLERAAVVMGNLPDDWVTALLAKDGQLLVGTYNAGVVGFSLSATGLTSLGGDRALGYVNPAGLFAFDSPEHDFPALAVASMDGLHVGALGATRLLPTRARDVTAVASALGGGYWIGSRRGIEWTESLSR